MKRTFICLSLGLGVLCLSPAVAQPPGGTSATKFQIYEDIEVMGRILDRALNLPRYTTVTLPLRGNVDLGLGMGGLGMGGLGMGNLGGGFQGDLGGFGGGQGGMGLGGGFAGGQGFSGGQGGLEGGAGGFPSPRWDRNRMGPVRVPSFPKAQATYIKGHGVVFSIVLPPSPSREPKPAVPVSKPASEWDQVRSQIRGTQAPSGAAETKPKDPSVADTVLEVLAKNGHHFSQLGDQENLTVSIIFRGPDQIPPLRGPRGSPLAIDLNAIHEVDPFTGTLVNVEESAVPFPSEGIQSALPAGGKGSSEKKKPGTEAGGGNSTDESSPRDYELLGDLHLKQGQGVEALRAYQQALDKSSDAQQAAEIFLKLAQLHLTVQKDEAKARQALMHARELLAQAGTPPAPALDKSVSKPASAASPLPERLIIAASKRLLDQVGAGKMSLEDFKKAATVERLTFSAPHK